MSSTFVLVVSSLQTVFLNKRTFARFWYCQNQQPGTYIDYTHVPRKFQSFFYFFKHPFETAGRTPPARPVDRGRSGQCHAVPNNVAPEAEKTLFPRKRSLTNLNFVYPLTLPDSQKMLKERQGGNTIFFQVPANIHESGLSGQYNFSHGIFKRFYVHRFYKTSLGAARHHVSNGPFFAVSGHRYH
jgi:hypothetical protein